MIYNYVIYQSFLYGVNNNKAFSLIELSIVLIIIGLLVAGIIGGKSLIESTRIRSLINDFRYYEQSLYSFKLIKNRLPGDFNGSGKIGRASGQVYNKNSFPSPYNKNIDFYGIPTEDTAPFVDLYLAKVIDFEPKKTESSNKNLSILTSNLPDLKIGFGMILFTYYGLDATGKFQSSCKKNHALCSIIGNNTIRWHAKEQPYRDMPAKFSKKLDLKIDDGQYDSGVVRGQCMPREYYTSYENATKCRSVFYILK